MAEYRRANDLVNQIPRADTSSGSETDAPVGQPSKFADNQRSILKRESSVGKKMDPPEHAAAAARPGGCREQDRAAQDFRGQVSKPVQARRHRRHGRQPLRRRRAEARHLGGHHRGGPAHRGHQLA